MKLCRFIFFAAIPVLLSGGLYTGLMIFYLLLFMQILMLASVFALDLWTVKTFRYLQQLERESVVKGTELELYIKIINDKPIPMSLMEIKVELVSYSEDARLLFSLAPFSEKEFKLNLTTPYRGVYKVGMTKIRITDIFGLMTLTFDMRKLSYYKMENLTVYPQVEELEAVAARVWDTKLFTASYLRQADDGDSISGTRAYRPGDALKRIHWVNSFRTRELYVRQYENPMREKVLIVLDSTAKRLTGEDSLYYADTMCSCAGSVALYNLTRGRETHLAASAPGGAVRRCESSSDFNPLYKWLATLEFSGDTSLADLIYGQLFAMSDSVFSLFVLTREPDPDLVSELISLQERCESVTLILIDDATEQNERLHTLYVKTGESMQALA